MTSRKSQGFTLIEIMVAIAIGALLLSGIIQAFVGFKTTDRVSNSLSRVQEAGRTALDIMAKDLRLAGYKGCADPAIIENVNIIASNPPTTNFVQTSLRGFDVTATGWASGNTDLSSIDGTAAGDARLNSDVVSIMRASTASSTLNEHDNNNSNVKVNGNPLKLDQGDIAIVSDCESMDIFRISNRQKDGATNEFTFTHGNGSGVNTSNKLSKAYTDETARLLTFVGHTYYVADTGRDTSQGQPIYALFRLDSNGNAEEIVEGVENLQITYGEEFINGNRRFVPASNASLDMTQVTAIKISILVAGNEPILATDDGFTYPMEGANAQPASSGGAVTYENDRRLRKVFNMTIRMRNKRVSI